MFEGIRRMLTVDSVTSYGQLVRGGEGREGKCLESEGRGSGYVCSKEVMVLCVKCCV